MSGTALSPLDTITHFVFSTTYDVGTVFNSMTLRYRELNGFALSLMATKWQGRCFRAMFITTALYCLSWEVVLNWLFKENAKYRKAVPQRFMCG